MKRVVLGYYGREIDKLQIRNLMKSTEKMEFSDFENYHRGKNSGEEKRRASAFWGAMQNQRMTQSERRAGAESIALQEGNSKQKKKLKP